jgi:YtfJ family uncharacterized protein
MSKSAVHTITITLGVLIMMAQLQLGEQPARIVLNGDLGGRLDGKPWDSSEMVGKVHVLMYIDPGKRNLNEHVQQELKRVGFPREQFRATAVINTQATWTPEWAMRSVLKDKEKEFPHTTYVLDNAKHLVKAWGLEDHNYDIVTFDKRGRVIFNKAGKLSPEHTEQLIQVIRENL